MRTTRGLLMMFLLCPSAYVLELELDGQSAAPLRWGPDDDLRAVARRWQGEHAAGRTDVEDVLMRFMEAHVNGSATAAADSVDERWSAAELPDGSCEATATGDGVLFRKVTARGPRGANVAPAAPAAPSPRVAWTLPPSTASMRASAGPA